MTCTLTTHRGFSVRTWGDTAVVIDDNAGPVHRSACVPARAARAVAERAFGQTLSGLLTRMAFDARGA